MELEVSPMEVIASPWDHKPTPRVRLGWEALTPVPSTPLGDTARIPSQPYREHRGSIVLTVVTGTDLEDE